MKKLHNVKVWEASDWDDTCICLDLDKDGKLEQREWKYYMYDFTYHADYKKNENWVTTLGHSLNIKEHKRNEHNFKAYQNLRHRGSGRVLNPKPYYLRTRANRDNGQPHPY